MPGVEYGPIKPTAIKLGKPVKMAVGKSAGKTPMPSAPGKTAGKVSMSPMPKTTNKMKKIAGKSRAGVGAGMPKMPKGTGKGFDGLSELG
jgi:hypothetical protein